MGFRFEEDTYKYLLLNSGYIGLLKRRGFLSSFLKLLEKKADPEIQAVIQVADSFRKETTGGKGLQDFITYINRYTAKPISEDKIQQAFFISLRPLFSRLEEFFFGSETPGKTLNLFLKFLTPKETDYYGLDAVTEVYNHIEQDPKLAFIKETVQIIGKAVGTLIKTLNGTGKWLENFKGDPDERIYNCIKIFNEQSKAVTSLFEYFNIENLRFLKLADRDPFLQADIRLAAMLADIRPEQIDSQIGSLKITSTLKDFDRSFIATLIKTIRILAMVSYSYADTIKVRRFGLSLFDLVQRLLVTKGLLIEKNEIVNELLEDAWRILKACRALKETKYANPVFTDINEGDLNQSRKVLEQFLYDTEQIKYFTDNYYPLTIKEIQEVGLVGKEIGDFVKTWKIYKVETIALLNYEEALKFLRKYMADLRKTGIAA